MGETNTHTISHTNNFGRWKEEEEEEEEGKVNRIL